LPRDNGRTLTQHDSSPGSFPARRRQRCPHCGGPAIELAQRAPEDEPAAVCITCGYEFPLRSQAGGARISGGLTVALLFLGAGLLAGVLLAVFSSATNVGGWLLVLAGVGLVVLMGAIEAGYLDSLLGRRRGPRPPSPPPPEI
jgi:hypothetical protein